MKDSTIKRAGKELAQQVDRDRRVVWPWSRWSRWTRDEIQRLADEAGIAFTSKGGGFDLTFFEFP